MNTKVFIALLAILVLLFVCGVGAGFTLGGGKKGPSAWQTSLLSFVNNLTKPRPVQAKDLVSPAPPDCWNPETGQIVLTGGGGCLVFLAPSGTPRKLTLQLSQGSGAVAQFVQPVNKDGDPLTAKKTLSAGEKAGFDVYRRQSADDRLALSAQCLDLGGKCVLTLIDQP
jgi:hypothetical protein